MARKHAPKELLERRTPQPQKPPKKKFSVDWKFWIGLLIAVAALWLTIEDRPTVSLGTPRDRFDIFSTPVTTVNNGVLPIWDVGFAIFIESAYTNGVMRMGSNIAGDYEYPTNRLDPGEPITQTFGHMYRGHDTFDTIDIALIVRYSPMWAPFWHRTRPFRFKAVRTDAGMILEQIPAGDVESDYRKQRALSH